MNEFSPTNEEIISFLEKKMEGIDISVHGFDEVDFYNYNPWELPELSSVPGNQAWYFFCPLSYVNQNSQRVARRTSAGYWKVTGWSPDIKDRQGGEVIGCKRVLVFYEGRGGKAVRTNWVMQEFCSRKAHSYQRKYILCRLKRWPVAGKDEPIHH